MAFDPRMLGGPAMIVLGALFLWMAWRLWIVPPVNRVFRLGPYVTERGMRTVIGLRLTFVAFGAFLLVFGLASVVFWYARRDVDDPLVSFLGSLGAGLGLWAAYMAIVAVVRLWRAK